MTVVQDVRYALRSLRSTPAFTIAALAILGLGIGAGTSIWTVANAVLLRPLPYPEAGRLVAICAVNPAVDRFCVGSPPDVEDWAASSRSFEAIGFARSWQFLMRSEAGPVGVSGGYATPAWFEVLRVAPQLGRVFAAGDESEGGRDVAVLGHALWVERFGGDPGVVGRSIALDGRPFRVVGVLPASFAAPSLDYVQLWTPPPWDARDESRRGWRGFQVVGRLAAGATLEQAGSELATIQAVLAREHAETNEGWGVRVLPLHELITGSTRPMFLVFGGAVALLLLIACANLANLMLVRATAREREMAVRAAIGAERHILLRQMLVESAVISVAGALLGFLLAWWVTGVFVGLAPAWIPRIDEVHVDATAFLVAMLLAFLTATAFGVGPALWSARVDLVRELREGMGAGRSRRGMRARRVLVAAEVALTLMLLIGTMLLGRSFGALASWDPGFDRENVLAFSAFASSERYPRSADVAGVWRRLEEQIAALPGVAAVSTASAGPLFGGIEPGPFRIEGDPPAADPPVARWYDAGPAYFRTLGIAIVRGRAFTEADAAGAVPVAVVNETFARRWFGGRDPIGMRVHMTDSGNDDPLEIIGIAADVAPFLAGRPVEAEIWWSNRQRPRWGTFFVVRGATDPGRLASAIRERIDEVDAELQTGTPSTLDQLVDQRLVAPRFNLALVGVLALVALVLAAAGVYGVLAYAVVLRHREIGIRMALGAGRASVVRRFLAEGATLAAAGIAAGTLGALGLAGFLRSMLYGVTTADPLAFAAAVTLLLLVASLACTLPSWRASRIDPARVLREE